MPITRYQLDQALLSPSRLGGVLRELGRIDKAYVDQPNVDLNEAIASALESIGVIPADRSAVDDYDLARVADGAVVRFLDIAEIRALEGLVAWHASRPRATRFPDWQIDRHGNSGEWLLSILKQKQARHDMAARQGSAEAARFARGIRRTLRMTGHLDRRRGIRGPSSDD